MTGETACRRSSVFLALFLLLAFAFVGGAFAQAPGASEVHGTVTDQTGGAVVGAVVAVDNPARVRWTTETDRQGHYTIAALPPGSYTLTAGARGFLEFTAPVDLRQAGAMRVDVALKVGISVSVEVAESADSRKNMSALVLTSRDIQRLPDDPRLFMLRLLEMAGSTGRSGDVAIYVDGFRQYKRLPPKSAIDMIRINSNPFSAEFSQPSVKRIEITTKPGSDGFHGDGAVQARSSKLESSNPVTGTKPQGEYRSYNGYLQGPLRRERVGFLVYAGRWQQDDNAFVHATILDPAPSLAQPFAATVSTPTTVTSVSLKTDFRFFNQLINASYERASETDRNQGLTGGFDLPEHGYDRSTTDNVGRLWWTAIGRRSINDVRVELTRNVSASSALATTPAILVLDAFNAGGNPNAGFRTNTSGLQASETLTVLQGRHVFKAGVRLDTTDQTSIDRTGFGGTFTFGADVERDASGQPVLNGLGKPTSISPIERYRRTVLGLPGYGPSQFAMVTGDPNVSVTQWNAGWFALDDWSISKRVSLSYGVRQELQNNLKAHVNLAPRGSLSWLLDDKGTNALKVGAGLFYAPVEAGITLDTRKVDGVRRQQIVVQHPAFFAGVPSSFDLATRVGSKVYTTADNLRMPYSFVTTFSYERQLPHGMFATAEYLFGKGVNQLRLRNTTAPAGVSDSGTISPILQFESTGRSLQHELTAGLRGDVSSRLTLYGNYKLGRKYSDTDGAYTIPAHSNDLSAEYGRSIDDRRHQIVGGVNAQAPGGIRIESEISVMSGRPFNITTGRDNDGDTIFTDRPAFANPGDAGAVVTPFGVFNPNPQPGDTIIPRNFGREPWQVDVGLAVSKTVLKALTITADAENLLNTHRYFGSNGVLTSPVFGLPNQALNARRLELAVRYGF